MATSQLAVWKDENRVTFKLLVGKHLFPVDDTAQWPVEDVLARQLGVYDLDKAPQHMCTEAPNVVNGDGVYLSALSEHTSRYIVGGPV
ncbi:hypothetical protein BKA93DRAFT_827518 [Sparassis latifolia]|uniref:Uncharacterized protein n=1 Tax=Sparassis crispa TaxID=139825 RepID=A0A401H5Y7_9APHY|nr:hypothetical protein SCP_1701470 [Sparassis crispa]GBE89822.1 hypothetical protein SCP_1701470 [Sparassis crispa]